MAIIYSYPKELNILPEDILIGTTTKLTNGKPKNQTRSYAMENIADFVISNVPRGTLTTSNDSNITLTLGGVPVNSLFSNVSITVGWTGLLPDNRIASAAYWNAKQDEIELTTNGVSGPATFIDNVLNVPNYGASSGGYVFVQAAPTTLWQINHSLNKFPSVTVVNINNVVMYGNVIYIDANNVEIEFSAGFSGKAYLN